MPAGSPLVDRDALLTAVAQAVADVMMVAPEKVRPETMLITDLGAESIDFLDLVYRLEDIIGRRIPASHWSRFVHERFGNRDVSHVITVDTMRTFAECEAALATRVGP